MHPALTTAILEEDLAEFAENNVLLHERGILILKAAIPELRVAIRHAGAGMLHVFQFLFEGWNEYPPRFSVLDPATGEALPGTRWPSNGSGQSYWHHDGWTAPSGLVLPKPFLCMRGIREYHEHKSHVTDLWSSYRDQPEFSLANIVLKVANLFQESHV
jgi:hypothetical protein